MKRIKHFLLTMLVFACAVTGLVGFAACGDDEESPSQGNNPPEHTHSYTSVVTDPTCTAQGYTTHTCTCGDSYQDTYVAALGHKNTTVINEYPSINKAGSKTHTCSVCNTVETVEIEALTLNLPGVADILKAVIGTANAKLTVDDASEITYVYEGFEEVEAKPYIKNVKIEVAEAVINTEDTFQGHIKFECKYLDQEFEYEDELVADMTKAKNFSMYLYVNGEDVTLEVTPIGGMKNTTEAQLSELAYSTVWNILGEEPPMPYENFLEVLYIGQEVAEYAPKFAALIAAIEGPQVSEEYIASLDELFELFGQNIITAEVDGTNTVYSLDLSALTLFFDEIDGKTLGTYIDEVYGAGSMAAFKAFAVGLPEMKVRDIATSAIALAEVYEINVTKVYDLIDLVIYKTTGASIAIQTEIESRYDMTLGEIVIETIGGEGVTVAAMKEEIATAIDEISATTFNDVFDMLAEMLTSQPKQDIEGGVDNEQIERITDGEEIVEESVLAQVREMVEAIAAMTDVQVVVDETGAVVNVNASIQMGEQFAGITFETTAEESEEGAELSYSYTGWKVTVTGTYYEEDVETGKMIATPTDMLIVEYKEGVQAGNDQQAIKLAVPSMAEQVMVGRMVSAKGDVNVMAMLGMYDAEEPDFLGEPIAMFEYNAVVGENNIVAYDAHAVMQEKEYFTFYATKEDGVLTELYALVSGYITTENVVVDSVGQENIEEVKEWVEFLEVDYQYTSESMDVYLFDIDVPMLNMSVEGMAQLDSETGNAMWGIGASSINGDEIFIFTIHRTVLATDTEVSVEYTADFTMFGEDCLDATVNMVNGELTYVDVDIFWVKETEETHYDTEGNKTTVTHVTESSFMITYEEQVWTISFTEFTDEELDGVATLTVGDGAISFVVDTPSSCVAVVGAVEEDGLSFTYDIIEHTKVGEETVDETLTDVDASLTMTEEGLVLSIDVNRWDAGDTAYYFGNIEILFQNFIQADKLA